MRVPAAHCSGFGVSLLLVGCFVKFIACDVDASCECGKPSEEALSMRIVGGRRAAPHSFPWTAAVLKGGRMHCGGAVVTDRHVLSAGHCVRWDDYNDMTVLLGLDNVDNLTNVEQRKISKAVIHENFKSTTVRDENDIAIFTLDRPVAFSATISPVCLPDPGQDFSGKVATIAGWGRIGSDKAPSSTLLKASLKILPYADCLNTKLAQHLTPTMLCSFSKGKDGCQGDSGGPLIVFDYTGKYTQVGVVSWGIGCADPRYPGVYTKVSDYIEWINHHTTDGITCAKT